MGVQQDDGAREVTPARIRFDIPRLMYVTALFATGVAAFGIGGAAPAAIVVAVWSYAFTRESRSKELFAAATGILIALLMFCVVVRGALAVRGTQGGADQARCSENLMTLAVAMRDYYFANGSFPPAHVADASGRPMHSWRVLLLPYINGGAFIHRAYKFNEPWNGPRNSALHSSHVEVFQCPNDEHNQKGRKTNYFAIVGDDTAWPGATGRKWRDLPTNSVLLIESHRHDVHWMEPRDLSVDEAAELLQVAAPHDDRFSSSSFFYEPLGGTNVALLGDMRDYHDPVRAKFVALGSNKGYYTILLTLGEQASRGQHLASARRKVRWGNVARLLAFAVLALLPLRWRKQRGSR